MRLIAITGMRYAPKVALVRSLVADFIAQGSTLALLDNTKQAIYKLAHRQRITLCAFRCASTMI